MCPILTNLNLLDTFLQISPISNFMQIRPLGDDGRRDRQTYMTMPIGAFRDFANARATNFFICKQNVLLYLYL